MLSIADDILIAEFGDMGGDHDDTLNRVLRICMQANLKLNKDKYIFWFTSIPFFGNDIMIRSEP